MRSQERVTTGPSQTPDSQDSSHANAGALLGAFRPGVNTDERPAWSRALLTVAGDEFHFGGDAWLQLAVTIAGAGGQFSERGSLCHGRLQRRTGFLPSARRSIC
jgi:hypothetical protein